MISPIEAVRLPDPYPYYADLVTDRPFGFDQDLQLWVAAGAAAVTAVLADPDCRVRPPAEPIPAGIRGTAAGEVFGRLVRMTDGTEQESLKPVVMAALDRIDPVRVRALTAELTGKVLAAGYPPLQRLMFGVPVQVVAALCGLDERSTEEAGRLIADFVQCIPASATPAQQAAAARAAAELRDLLGPRTTEGSMGLLGDLVRAATGVVRHDHSGLLANGIGLLSQTFDATAGLIGNTLIGLARHHRRPSVDELEPFVREVVRHDVPIQNTRRFAAQALTVEGERIETGQAILLLLAAANRDPAANIDPDAFQVDRRDPAAYTFSAGRHRCPGETLAVTITTTIVGGLLAAGWNPDTLPPGTTYLASPNARIPVLTGP